MSKPIGTRNNTTAKALEYFRNIREANEIKKQPKKLVQGISYFTEENYFGVVKETSKA